MDAQQIQARLAELELEVTRLAPLAERTNHSRKFGGLQHWSQRNKLSEAREEMAALMAQLRTLGIEYQRPTRAFAFDVREFHERGAIRITADPAPERCTHNVTAESEDQARWEAIKEHKAKCLGQSKEVAASSVGVKPG